MNKSYNILITLMTLQIGGAETHAVELARGLKREGHNVCIASNGGIYEEELARFGIKHYKVPLHSKKLNRVMTSLSILKKIVKEEKIDIVHAHGRIPASVCGILQKFMGYAFVTTAHGIRSTGLVWKYITDWGQKTIAVSEDIKADLITTYKVKPENIIVTINGIDTNRFSPNICYNDAVEELGIYKEGNKIVYISRIDRDRQEILNQLLEVIPLVQREIEDVQLVIVGNGEIFPQIKEAAEEKNKAMGRDVIVLPGARADIEKFVGMADLFIGFGRSSLEALSEEKCVILASSYGYIGLFNEEKLNNAIKTNFSCRGCKKIDNNDFAKDIIRVLRDMSKEDRKALGEFGRNVILDKYSIDKMIQDNISLYNMALQR